MLYLPSLRLLALCLVGSLWPVSFATAQTRVAFLGDSITAGQGTGRTPEDRAFFGYPAVVARLLGDDFEVEAFGAGGHALRTDAPLVYGNSKVFQSALEFKPEIAVIMLGTNDSGIEEPMEDWRSSFNALLGPLREANPGVRVLLASPPEMFLSGERVSEKRKEVLAPRRQRLDPISESLRQLARETDGVKFVDVRGFLRPRDALDGVHLNPFGAARLAYRFAGAIQMEESSITAPAVELLARRPTAKVSELDGFQAFEFSLEPDVEGSPSCTLVAPDRIAAGAPWIWREGAAPGGALPDRALLKRGLHVVYVGSFKSEAGRCAAFCRQLGLAEEPISDVGEQPSDVSGARFRSLLLAAGIHTAESEPTVTPNASSEYRGKPAGWGGGTWRTALASLQELSKASASEAPVDVLFLGDSITQGLTGHSQRFAEPGGERVIDRAAGGRRVVSLGLSGDRTEHLLYRIDQGSLDGFRPRVIVLQIGVNNVNKAEHSGEETYRGIVAVVQALRQRLPESKILISGPFPAGVGREGRVRKSIEGVHVRLAQHSFDEAVSYLNLARLFVEESGALRETMGSDGIHVTEAGHEAWMKAIEPTLARLLDGVSNK